MSHPCLSSTYFVQNVSVTHISGSLICNGNTAENEGIAVVFGGGAWFTDTFEQLPYSSILPLSDEPLAGPHVDRLGLQLEVLKKGRDVEEEHLNHRLVNMLSDPWSMILGNINIIPLTLLDYVCSMCQIVVVVWHFLYRELMKAYF